MARYSSESDSDYNSKYRRRRSRKSRSSSSESSDSSPYRRRSSKHSKQKRRHYSRSRSRGRERNSKSYRSGRSHSRDKRRYRSAKGRSDSSDHRGRYRSASREKSRSRSSSSQSKILSEKQTIMKDDFPIEPRFKEGILEEINSEGFTPKQFASSQKESKFKNIVIDISADTIQIPAVTETLIGSESIFHSSITSDQEARFDKWVKKLYVLRQKAMADLSNIT